MKTHPSLITALCTILIVPLAMAEESHSPGSILFKRTDDLNVAGDDFTGALPENTDTELPLGELDDPNSSIITQINVDTEDAGAANGINLAEDNFDLAFTFQFYDGDGQFSFTENFDDRVQVNITPIVSASNLASTGANGPTHQDTRWNTRTYADYDFGVAGWFHAEIILTEDAGGALSAGGIGFGYSNAASTGTEGDYALIGNGATFDVDVNGQSFGSSLELGERADRGVIINEFMAVNNSTLRDEDGEYSDWIELLNTGENEVNLAGWYLTDTAGNLSKWAFPNVTIRAGAYLVLFASNKDRTDPTARLHTNFRLDGGGEYLALVRPDGVTIASEFSPAYPDQAGDESFGVVREIVKLVPEGASGRYLVPSGSLAQDWTGGQAFDDSLWESGQASLGFDHGVGGYFSIFLTDINEVMFNKAESVYLRVPFTVPSGLDLESIHLQMQYDDGFVAYLNGNEIGSSNAPDSPSWNSLSTAAHPDAAAIMAETFPIANGVAGLQGDTNYLAIHGLNHQPHDRDPDFLLVPELEGVNRIWTYLNVPSPGTGNGSGMLLNKVNFSPGRGFYEVPVRITLSTEVANAEIRYTTDFSEPTESSALYTRAIAIVRSTVIRAAVFKTGFQPSPLATHSFIYLSDVLTQPASPRGWPTTWGNKTAEYEMRPSVIDDQSEAEFVSYLRSLPSIMISSSMENLFDNATGIYDHPTSRGVAWERSGSVEWLYGDGRSGFGENCGIRIQGGLGGGGRSYEKKSWRLLFKSIYGPSKLRFPFFAWDSNATQSFDQLILRAGANDRQDYTRDEYARRCQIAMEQPGSHGIHVHVYLNGLYWGMYNAVERPAGDFAASYFGGEKEDYDALAHNSGNVIDGDNTAWNAMVSLGRRGLSRRDNYMEIQGKNPEGTNNPDFPHYVDLDHYIDYMLANIYLGMGDWPGHNWYAARRRDAGSDGYKFFIWDGEGAFGSSNVTGVSNGAGETYADLRANPEFNLLFADHVHRHLFNDGALTPSKAMSRFAELSDKMEFGVVTEQARWGHISLSSWRSRRDSKLNSYLRTRRDTVLGHLRGAGLYPQIDAPSFNQHGGEVSGGFPIALTAANGASIFYTLDGSDPREPWTGNAVGSLYSEPIPVAVNVHVKARSCDGANNWSALTEAVFMVSGDSFLRVSEVMFNPRQPRGAELEGGFAGSDFEFVEIENTGLETVGLAGLRLAGGLSFDFTGGAVGILHAGESVVVVRNLAAFQVRYPNWLSMKIAGEFEGTLDNSGDDVSLVGLSGVPVWSVSYDDSRGWPVAADGAGHSLVPLQFSAQPSGILNYGGNWRASTFIDGSPGALDALPISNVVLNEIVAHTWVDLPPHDSNDGIELFNQTRVDLLLRDWYLSDDANDLRKWQIPASSMLAGIGWLYFDEITGFHQPITSGFGLNKEGGRVFVSHLPGTDQDRVADAVRYKGQEMGRSLGRYPDGDLCWDALMPTAGASNRLSERKLIIGEIMYDPPPTAQFPVANSNDEYIKICNLSAAPVLLSNSTGEWRIDGPDFEFPANTAIPAGGSLLVVSFDPASDPAALAAFQATYGLTAGSVPIIGPYQRPLDDEGGRIALERPQAPDISNSKPSWVIVDEVIYFNKSPWSSGANESGRSLVRLSPLLCGNSFFNWNLSAVGGTPDSDFLVPVGPVIALSLQTLELTTPENVNLVQRQFSVRNVGVSSLEFTVTDNVSWLSVRPVTGQVAEGKERSLVIEFSTANLPVGSHTGTVVITSANAANAPRTLDVNLVVIERDRVRPTLLSVDPLGSFTELTCIFSRPLEIGSGPAGAENPANYQLSNGVAITGVSLSGQGTVVTLTTSGLTPNVPYTLTVNNVQDRAIIPNPILGNTQFHFTYLYTEPVADAGTGGAAGANSSVDLNGAGSIDLDRGPLPLSYFWEQIHGPAAAITNPDQEVASVALGRKGTYVFRLTVTDGTAADSDTVVFLVSETVTVFSAGQTWRFLDTGVDLGTAWRAVDYDDSSWGRGVAQLGYGDGDEVEVVNFGPDDGAKYLTTYFRSEFVVTNAAAIGGLTFHVLRDDGAVIYLNGIEVARSNMREGIVDYLTMADRVVGGNEEDTFFPYPTSADDLVEGTNLLAVEIHQISSSSSDISFDLSLDTEVGEFDEDGDEMPDYWEVLTFGTTNRSGGGDGDHDGMSNYEEFVAGTDPIDPESNFSLWVANEGGEVVVHYKRVAIRDAVLAPTARYYTLESSIDGTAGSWQAVPGHRSQLGDDSSPSYLHLGGEPTKFFRLRVWIE